MIQMTGMEMAVATGTTQRRSVRAPHTISPAAATIRSHSGGVIASNPTLTCGPVAFELVRNLTHSNQALGAIANETAVIKAVAPSAQASDRHSRRTTNHSSETPRHFGQDANRPQGRVFETKDANRGEQDVDVAVEELERDRQEDEPD